MSSDKRTVYEYSIPVSITLILLAVSFILHVKACGSPMTAPPEVWQKRIDVHLTRYPFTIRYFTTYSVLFMNKFLSLPYREAFFILQFGLAFVLGPIFYRFLKELKFRKSWANVGLVILFTSYPIMAAHFEPVHTWDDFWTYSLVVLTFYSMLRGRLLAASIFFTLACLSREQALLFYPALILAAYFFAGHISLSRKVLYLLVPAVIFAVFSFAVSETPHPGRFSLVLFNFENALRTSDTLFSFYVSFGFVWVAAAIPIFRSVRGLKNAIDRFLVLAAVVTVPSNVVLTLLFTYARETRIFFPPFIFLIPLALLILEPTHIFIRKELSRQRRVIALVIFHALMFAGIYLARFVFPHFEYRQCANYCREWAGINFGIIATLAGMYVLFPKLRRLCSAHNNDRSMSESFSSS
jgi:hypothetical protein